MSNRQPQGQGGGTRPWAVRIGMNAKEELEQALQTIIETGNTKAVGPAQALLGNL